MSTLDPTPLLGPRERPQRDRILATLRTFAPALAALGLTKISLFGSVARDEAHEQSDVDLLACVEDPKNLDVPALVTLQSEMSIACRSAVTIVMLGVDRHSLVCLARFHPDLLRHIQPDLLPLS
jgi:predicted nucleotidyltransferase